MFMCVFTFAWVVLASTGRRLSTTVVSGGTSIRMAVRVPLVLSH